MLDGVEGAHYGFDEVWSGAKEIRRGVFRRERTVQVVYERVNAFVASTLQVSSRA